MPVSFLRGPELRALKQLEPEYQQSPYVFVTERVVPITTSAVTKIVSRAGEKIMPLDERHLCGEGYTKHYHIERNHQGFGNQRVDKARDGPHMVDNVKCRERLGSFLKYYYRTAG